VVKYLNWGLTQVCDARFDDHLLCPGDGRTVLHVPRAATHVGECGVRGRLQLQPPNGCGFDGDRQRERDVSVRVSGARRRDDMGEGEIALHRVKLTVMRWSAIESASW